MACLSGSIVFTLIFSACMECMTSHRHLNSLQEEEAEEDMTVVDTAVEEQKDLATAARWRKWPSIKKFVKKYVKKALDYILKKRREKQCREIAGSGVRTLPLDRPCNSQRCDSCQSICSRSSKPGGPWQCKSGYNQIFQRKTSCTTQINDTSFCCCVEVNRNLGFLF